jgi:hypothetical protein
LEPPASSARSTRTNERTVGRNKETAKGSFTRSFSNEARQNITFFLL